MQELLATNFHARVLHLLDPDLCHSEKLDDYFDEFMFKMNARRLKLWRDLENAD